MNPHNQKGKTINYRRQSARFAFLAALLLITLVSAVTPGAAADTKPAPAVTFAGLKGPWAMSLEGVTGCGETTMYVTFTLNTTGSGTATIVGHSAGCGDNTTTGLPFVIQTLNPNGSGTANLSCGTNCGWPLVIQVAKNSQIFSAVVVAGNYLEGTAIHQ
jgi:hypothetical protein